LKAIIIFWVAGLWLLNGIASVGQPAFDRLLPAASAFQTDPSADEAIGVLLVTHSDLSQEDAALALQKLENLLQQVKRGRRGTDHQGILKQVFDEGRRQFLLSYDKNYPHFSRLFTDGSYNCVTGTALYAWVLHRLGYRVQLHETAFHAYLTVRTEHTVYLMDATDPHNGFVAGAAAVGKRELWYTGNEIPKGIVFHRLISIRELCGLQYYNQAVVAFNRQAYEQSLFYLQQALALYPQSDRIRQLKETTQRLQREVMAYSTITSRAATGENDE